MSAAADTHVRQHYNVTLAVLVTGALAYALSQTMIAPALPEIQAKLGHDDDARHLRPDRVPADRFDRDAGRRPAR